MHSVQPYRVWPVRTMLVGKTAKTLVRLHAMW